LIYEDGRTIVSVFFYDHFDNDRNLFCKIMETHYQFPSACFWHINCFIMMYLSELFNLRNVGSVE